MDAYIPDTYIPNEYQKLDVYKRIAAIGNDEEMDDMLEELIDRFGDIPLRVQRLLAIAGLKARAHKAYVTAVEQKESRYVFTMYERAKVDPLKIPDMLAAYKGSLVFRAEEPPYFVYEKKGGSRKAREEDPLEVVKKVLISLEGLLE